MVSFPRIVFGYMITRLRVKRYSTDRRLSKTDSGHDHIKRDSLLSVRTIATRERPFAHT